MKTSVKIISRFWLIIVIPCLAYSSLSLLVGYSRFVERVVNAPSPRGWQYFYIEYLDEFINFYFLLVIIVSRRRDRFSHVGMSLLYLTWVETSCIPMAILHWLGDPTLHGTTAVVYVGAQLAIGAAMFVALCALALSDPWRSGRTSLVAFIALCLSLYWFESKSQWHAVNLQLFDPIKTLSLKNKFPLFLVASYLRLTIATLMTGVTLAVMVLSDKRSGNIVVVAPTNRHAPSRSRAMPRRGATLLTRSATIVLLSLLIGIVGIVVWDRQRPTGEKLEQAAENGGVSTKVVMDFIGQRMLEACHDDRDRAKVTSVSEEECAHHVEIARMACPFTTLALLRQEQLLTSKEEFRKFSYEYIGCLLPDDTSKSTGSGIKTH
jgi:hypothetical protein